MSMAECPVGDGRRVRRTKTLDVQPLGGDRYAFTARLTDVSAGGDHGSGGGEARVIHDFEAEGEVTGALLEIARLEIRAPTTPYPTCPFVLRITEDLVGEQLAAGWRRTVLAHGGGTRGCTHVNTMLLGLSEIQTMVFFLRMNGEVPFTAEARRDGTWMRAGLAIAPQLVDACYSLRRDGPVLGTAERAGSDGRQRDR
ncbi:MAG: DUF2889 domain-containing protein [Nocardiopsaceae bacterium]|jgi:hypothetical protein|nr:DUF2889 domain-containing protein [Nocardiopsaceae bacterium]